MFKFICMIFVVFIVGCGSDEGTTEDSVKAANSYCASLDKCSIPVGGNAGTEDCGSELLKQPAWHDMPNLIAQKVITCGDNALNDYCIGWNDCITSIPYSF